MLPQHLQETLDRFATCANARERLALLLSLGRSLAPLQEEHKREETKVPGCQSVVYIIGQIDKDNGQVSYQGSSDALLVKGMVALLIEGLRGLTPAQILDLDPAVLRTSGLGQSLVPSRANGLYTIFLRMKDEAARLQDDANCVTTAE